MTPRTPTYAPCALNLAHPSQVFLRYAAEPFQCGYVGSYEMVRELYNIDLRRAKGEPVEEDAKGFNQLLEPCIWG